ncbi:MAG: nucleoside phosphorylase domain-containing protein, partial [Olpidium bornovanus]
MAAAADDLKIAVIGGSGLYSMEGLRTVREVYPMTPWGYPSDKVWKLEAHASLVHHRGDNLGERGQQVAFLARHGQGHVFNPSEIPVRANIAALKSLGVQVIIAYSAVGSLREEIRPRDFVLPYQIIDRTKGIRPSTFFEGGLTSHVAFADPFCKPLANLISAQASALAGQVTLHQGKTLVCMEGPAFSTRAESNLYRAWGGD